MSWAAGAAVSQTNRPVSFFREVVPIFKRSCNGCHHPGKLKGELDMTTYQAFEKGGKHGPSFKAGDPAHSLLIEQITGEEPSMPKEGDPLSKSEIAVLERWIKEGAKDDTPADAYSFKLSAPPVYPVPPVISTIAISPDGKRLAVSGYHEVLLHDPEGSNHVARLVGESTRIESVAFSSDGKWLAVSGGAPAQFGEIQIWDLTTNALAKSIKVTTDSLYGVAFSPDSEIVAFGCADKTLRAYRWRESKEILKFDNHSDWVFSALFTTDGKRVLSGSRDRAMKLISLANGQFIDDINKLLEGVLCMARHPKENLVAYGGEMGTPRIYRISENQGRTAANNDVNLVKEFERQPGPVHAVAYSPDGAVIAVASVGGEVRLYQTSDAKRKATLKGHEGAVFALAFHPTKQEIFTGGFDGKIRVFNPEKGELIREFIPVPLKATEPVQKTAKLATP
jgi:WD40 repeat protein